MILFKFLVHRADFGSGGTYRIGSGLSSPVSSLSVWCQYFQTTSPLKPLGHLGPDFIYGILGLRD